MICQVCSFSNEAKAVYCATCGCDLKAAPLTCNHCQSLNPQRSQFCRKCGQKIVLMQYGMSSTQRRQKAKALIMAKKSNQNS